MQLTNKNNNNNIILIIDNKNSFEFFKVDINYQYFDIIFDIDDYITINIKNYDENIDDIEFEIDLSPYIKDKSLLIIDGNEYYFNNIKEIKKSLINYFKKCNG